jgi:riboflavin kinase / FMN adenylyltransferase
MHITGRVIRGSGDGRRIGFPTANIEITTQIELEYGVYASRVFLDKEIFFGITHFGPRSVFGETHPQFETHIFDFDRDIYDSIVEVEILDRVRGTMKFASLDEMVEQIEADILKAKLILQRY